MRSPTREFSEEEKDDEEESYISCSDSEDSDNEVWYTPPQSPMELSTNSDDDDEINAFEESLESFEDEKVYSLFIDG